MSNSSLVNQCETPPSIPSAIQDCTLICDTASASRFEQGTCKGVNGNRVTNPTFSCGDSPTGACVCNATTPQSVSSNTFILDVIFDISGLNLPGFNLTISDSSKRVEYGNNGNECTEGSWLIPPPTFVLGTSQNPATSFIVRSLFNTTNTPQICSQNCGRTGIIKLQLDYAIQGKQVKIDLTARRNLFGTDTGGDCLLTPSTSSSCSINNTSHSVSGDTSDIPINVKSTFQSPRTAIFTISGGIQSCPSGDVDCAGTGKQCVNGVCVPGCGGVPDCDRVSDPQTPCNTCPSGEFCPSKGSKCVNRCTSDRQCPTGQGCNSISGKCDRSCSEDSDCKSGQYCNTNGLCKSGCRGVEPCDNNSKNNCNTCPSKKFCPKRGSRCVDSCTSNDQCQSNQICDPNTGQCKDVQCKNTKDCPLGQICVNNKCETSGNGGNKCNNNNQCKENERCENNRCVPVQNTNDWDRDILIYGGIGLGVFFIIAIIIFFYIY